MSPSTWTRRSAPALPPPLSPARPVVPLASNKPKLRRSSSSRRREAKAHHDAKLRNVATLPGRSGGGIGVVALAVTFVCLASFNAFTSICVVLSQNEHRGYDFNPASVIVAGEFGKLLVNLVIAAATWLGADKETRAAACYIGDFPLYAIPALMWFLSSVLNFQALRLLSPGAVRIFANTSILWIGLGTHFVIGHRLSCAQWGGLLMLLLGVVVANMSQLKDAHYAHQHGVAGSGMEDTNEPAVGITIVLAIGVCSAVASLGMQHILQRRRCSIAIQNVKLGCFGLVFAMMRFAATTPSSMAVVPSPPPMPPMPTAILQHAAAATTPLLRRHHWPRPQAVLKYTARHLLAAPTPDQMVDVAIDEPSLPPLQFAWPDDDSAQSVHRHHVALGFLHHEGHHGHHHHHGGEYGHHHHHHYHSNGFLDALTQGWNAWVVAEMLSLIVVGLLTSVMVKFGGALLQTFQRCSSIFVLILLSGPILHTRIEAAQISGAVILASGMILFFQAARVEAFLARICCCCCCCGSSSSSKGGDHDEERESNESGQRDAFGFTATGAIKEWWQRDVHFDIMSPRFRAMSRSSSRRRRRRNSRTQTKTKREKSKVFEKFRSGDDDDDDDDDANFFTPSASSGEEEDAAPLLFSRNMTAFSLTKKRGRGATTTSS